ncbi:sigma factor [Microbacterium sp. NPDC056234]|uniref:sigma factor n=1 Tax=Microbacterium sp. NPDC056234 TaxID=3345757 RepID=UPI0035DFFA4F
MMRVAFRMVGSLIEAEDVVQDAFERWYRLPAARRRDVRNPAAWLTTVVSRICRSALPARPMT